MSGLRREIAGVAMSIMGFESTFSARLTLQVGFRVQHSGLRRER